MKTDHGKGATPTWPNWRSQITKKTLVKNSLICDLYDQLKKLKQEKKSETLWETHNKSLELKCEGCNILIWVKCVSKHHGHRIKAIEDKLEEINQECHRTLKKISMKSSKLKSLSNRIDGTKLVRDTLIEKVVKPWLNEMAADLNSLTNQTLQEDIKSIKSHLSELGHLKRQHEEKDSKINSEAYCKKQASLQAAEKLLSKDMRPSTHAKMLIPDTIVKVFKFSNNFKREDAPVVIKEVTIYHVPSVGIYLSLLDNEWKLRIQNHHHGHSSCTIVVTHPTTHTSKIINTNTKVHEVDIGQGCHILYEPDSLTISTDFTIIHGGLTKYMQHMDAEIDELFEQAKDKVHEEMRQFII